MAAERALDNAIGPQPDFNILAQAFTTVSTQMFRCGNLPAMHDNAQILQALQGIVERLGRMEQSMDERFERMEQSMDERFGRMETRAIAADKNNIARTCNSRLSRDDNDLAPLVNATTNEDIPNFPRTIRDLAALQLGTLNTIIRALGGNGTGAVENKRRELRTLCGLTPVAV